MAATFVTVETFSREIEALIVKSRLDAEGIESFVADGHFLPGVMGVRLFVREEDLEDVKKFSGKSVFTVKSIKIRSCFRVYLPRF